MMKILTRILAAPLIAFLILGGAPVVAAPQGSPPRGLISTQDALQADRASADRERINEILARQAVQDQLIALGVNPADVEARVTALSDVELRQMAAHLENLPAGANAIVGALVFVFIVLLITDLLGLTNVFPFTR